MFCGCSSEFKKDIVLSHETEGRTYKSISAECGISEASISMRCRESHEGGQPNTLSADIGMPLLFLDMPFQPGACLEQIGHIKDIAEMDLAMMQYDYYTCRHEQAAEKASAYLHSENLKIRIGALLIFTFSNMAMGNAKEAQQGKAALEELIAGQSEFSRQPGISLMLSAVKTVLHMPLTDAERQEINAHSGAYSEGGRLLCCYLLEQEAWEHKEWERVIGAVETALHMTRASYPLITLYFYLSASESALQLKDVRRAESYFHKAWRLAQADGFWSPMGEMRGHLQLFLEKEAKHKYPSSYKQIVQATHQYRSGWKALIREGISSKEGSPNAQEFLSGMEYAVSFLAGLGWSNHEIADYFGISERTVKYYMTAVFNKLNIDRRQEISGRLD